MSNHSDEAELLQTPSGFATLYNRYYPAVYRYIRYRVDDEDLAADLTAQTFLRALDRLHTFHPERGTFAAWLFRIARNQVNSHYRWRKRHPQVPIERAETIPDEKRSMQTLVEIREENAALQKALRSLTPRERDLLGLKFASRLSHREIAALTGLKENHVGVILYRALRRLRALLTEASHE